MTSTGLAADQQRGERRGEEIGERNAVLQQRHPAREQDQVEAEEDGRRQHVPHLHEPPVEGAAGTDDVMASRRDQVNAKKACAPVQKSTPRVAITPAVPNKTTSPLTCFPDNPIAGTIAGAIPLPFIGILSRYSSL